MELKTVVSKRVQLLSAVYDLFHVPSLLVDGHLYAFNMGDMSRALYVGYMLERRGLWGEAVRAAVGVDKGGESVEGLLKILDGVNVYGWSVIERELQGLANRVLKVYRMRRERVMREISRILGVTTYYREVYLILGFNPTRALYGSLLHGENPDYAIVSAMVRPDSTAASVVDVLLHELLHGLIRINSIEVPDEIEEDLIDTLCPDGFLSSLLGLSNNLKTGSSELQRLIETYFTRKLYAAGVKLPDYIRRVLDA